MRRAAGQIKLRCLNHGIVGHWRFRLEAVWIERRPKSKSKLSNVCVEALLPRPASSSSSSSCFTRLSSPMSLAPSCPPSRSHVSGLRHRPAYARRRLPCRGGGAGAWRRTGMASTLLQTTGTCRVGGGILEDQSIYFQLKWIDRHDILLKIYIYISTCGFCSEHP